MKWILYFEERMSMKGFRSNGLIRYALSHDSPGKQMRDAMRVTSDGLLIMHARDFIA